MKMKRFLAVLMIFTLVFTTVACSNDSSDDGANDSADDGEKVLKIAGLNGGYGTEHWEALAENFEESHEGVKVELTLEKNIAEVLRPQIQAGNSPDLIYLAVGGEGKLTDTLIKEKAIQDIDDVFEMDVPGEDVKVSEKLIDGFTDTLITNPYEDGKTYLAPLFYSPTGLFYNANNFDGKYELPTTFDEFFALGKEAKGDAALFTYPTTGYFDAFFYALLNETGGPDVFNKAMNYDVETWKSDEVKEAFEIVGKIGDYTHENTVSQANGENFTKNQQMILDNEALFIPNGTWLPGEMKDAPREDGFEWGLMALPKVSEGGDRYSYTFFEQMYIPKEAKNADLAKEFMAYMYSDEAAEIIYEKAGAVQPIKGASDMMNDDDPNKLYYSIYDNEDTKAAMGGFAAAPPVEGVDLTSGEGILFGTINSVVSGDKTVDEWHKEVVEAVEKINEAKENQ
ncbi:carbohydrate ABC transporter substrate-binding protein [Senegalia sp. (in: firmicutes)]|uniref:carbohydrate ABC transporter substrate-binding protein n=1 Tax=Bacillota TaxID=1239 RepID=UPI003F964CAF